MALAPRDRNKLWCTAHTTGTPAEKQASRRQIKDVLGLVVWIGRINLLSGVIFQQIGVETCYGKQWNLWKSNPPHCMCVEDTPMQCNPQVVTSQFILFSVVIVDRFCSCDVVKIGIIWPIDTDDMWTLHYSVGSRHPSLQLPCSLWTKTNSEQVETS